ncbi:MAG: ArgE/DapE family deacylase [Vicinamibacterales bacterium]|nr:ArgE/DapE family deacylase [Vicinamibacterales bacterium]
MTDLERRVLAALDPEALVDTLCRFVAVRSLNGTPGEDDAQRFFAGEMRAIGLDVDTWPLDMPSLRRHPAYTAETERAEGLGVTGSMGRGDGPSLILNGHVDVVPVGDERRWTYPPWQGTVADGRVYGRGALDMKGALCCALFAAKAIRDAGVALAGRLLIQSVIGEEDGGTGTLGAIVRGPGADAAIVMEPTELQLAPAQAGALNFRITVPGRTAHGAMRAEGVSAIEKFVPILQALLAFEADRNEAIRDPLFASYALPIPLCPGIVRAGHWASNVAESLVCEGRYGIAVGEDLAAARDRFEDAVARAALEDPWLSEHPPLVEWWGAQFAPASIPADHAIVRAVGAAFEDAAGRTPRLQGMTYGADMRLLVNQGGIPTMMFGPGDIRVAHQPDEHVPIDDLVTATRTLALTAVRFCGTRA